MNFHTFELYYRLSASELSSVKDMLWSMSGTYKNRKERIPTLECRALKDNGIHIMIKEYIHDDYKFGVLYYRVNPRRVFQKNNYIGIFNAKDTDKLVDKFNKLVNGISYMLPEFDSCKLYRFDLCSNIELSGQDEICEYIKILQRGYIPAKYTLQLYKDEKAKRRKQTKSGMTVYGDNGIDVIFYNKKMQMDEQELPYSDIERLRRIIRIEIHCNSKKIRHLTDKFGYTKASTFLKHSSEIGLHLWNKYVSIFFGEGEFCKLKELCQRIESSTCKQKSKKLMKEVVTLSAKHSSLQKAFDVLDLTEKKRKEVIKKFNKIGVSPVVIPRRSDYNTFQNPLTLALDWCEFDDLCM